MMNLEVLSQEQPWWTKRAREPDEVQGEAVRSPDEARARDIVGRANEQVEAVKTGVWMLKNNVKRTKNRYGWQKMTAFTVVTILAIGGTAAHIDLIFQVVTYLLWLAVFFLADPLRMWGRFLALPTRIFIAASSGTLILMCCRPGVDTAVLCVAAIGTTVLVTKFLNVQWLIADNWNMSENAQKSMTYDVEDISGRSWQASGKREARAMLYELGLQAGDDVLDVYGLPLYKLGYCSGLQKQGQIEANKSKLEALKVQCQYDSEQIASLEKQLESYKVDFEEKEAENKGLMLTVSGYQKKIKDLEHRAELLEAANEELLQGDPEVEAPDNIVPFSKEEAQEEETEPERSKTGALSDEDIARIQEMKEAGHSYNEIAKAVGCSKSTAGKYCRMA